jgi:integrase
LALATGARRNELLALRWSHVNFDRGALTIEGSLEQTKGRTIRVKGPKTAAGVRILTLGAETLAMLRHRIRQLEARMALGLGKGGAGADPLVFSEPDGSVIMPDDFSRRWHAFVHDSDLPHVSFHSLRHVHASALLAAGVNLLMVSKRLGHAGANVTLATYAHLLQPDDAAAAQAIETFLKRSNQ